VAGLVSGTEISLISRIDSQEYITRRPADGYALEKTPVSWFAAFRWVCLSKSCSIL
jgi:hypothetical protein